MKPPARVAFFATPAALLATYVALAGPVTPPPGPVGDSGPTLQDVFDAAGGPPAPASAFISALGSIVEEGSLQLFARVEGIDGDSQDPDHGDWIDLLSVAFGGGRSEPDLGGRDADELSLSVVRLVLDRDRSFAPMFGSLVDGAIIPRIDIEVVRDLSDFSFVSLELVLTNARVLSVAPAGNNSYFADIVYDAFELTQNNVDPQTGASRGSVTVTVDLTAL